MKQVKQFAASIYKWAPGLGVTLTPRLWFVGTRAAWHGVSKWVPVLAPHSPALWASEVTQAVNLTSKTDPKTGPKVGLSRKVRTVFSPTREPRFQGLSLSRMGSFLVPKLTPLQNTTFCVPWGPLGAPCRKNGSQNGLQN